jgi:hypothetical protein
VSLGQHKNKKAARDERPQSLCMNDYVNLCHMVDPLGRLPMTTHTETAAHLNGALVGRRRCDRAVIHWLIEWTCEKYFIEQ